MATPQYPAVDDVVRAIVEALAEPAAHVPDTDADAGAGPSTGARARAVRSVLVMGPAMSGKSTVLKEAAAKLHESTGCRVVRWQPAETMMKLPLIDTYARLADGTRAWSVVVADDVDDAIQNCKGVGCAGLCRTLKALGDDARVWLLMSTSPPGGSGLSQRVLKSLKDAVDLVVALPPAATLQETTAASSTTTSLPSMTPPPTLHHRVSATVSQQGDLQQGRWDLATTLMEAAGRDACDGVLEKIAASMRSLLAVHNFSAGGLNIR